MRMLKVMLNIMIVVSLLGQRGEAAIHLIDSSGLSMQQVEDSE